MRAIGQQLLLRMRIIHHRDPSLRAVVVIVPQAQRVADFMRGQLPDARQRRPIQNIGLFVAGRVRRKQPFEDQVILPVAQRAQRDRALDDLAGARIADRAADSSSRAWSDAPS